MKRAGALLGLAFACAAVDAGAQIPAIGRGRTIDFVYDGSDVRHPTEAYVARLFLPGEVKKTPDVPRPLLVFLHGVNPDHVRFRFTGGKPDEPDLRLIVAELIEAGTIPPVIVAAPSSVVSSELPTTLWPDFDLDRFVERTARTLRGKATIDLDAVVVVGHSGAGCNPKGGLASALAGTSLPVRAALSIDTCMTVADARALGDAPPLSTAALAERIRAAALDHAPTAQVPRTSAVPRDNTDFRANRIAFMAFCLSIF